LTDKSGLKAAEQPVVR